MASRARCCSAIAFKVKHEQNGYVFLLGRPSGNGVKVCAELAINDNEADALLLKVDQDVIGSAEPTVEFMARTVSIAELVRDGRDSGITKDGTQAGEKYKVARTYSLTHFDGTQRMVVSARYAEASAVVHATPKASVHLGDVEPGQAALLNANASADITKLFGNAARRLLMSVNAVQGDAAVPVRWTVCTDLGGATSDTEFDWTSMYAEAHLPAVWLALIWWKNSLPLAMAASRFRVRRLTRAYLFSPSNHMRKCQKSPRFWIRASSKMTTSSSEKCFFFRPIHRPVCVPLTGCEHYGQ